VCFKRLNGLCDNTHLLVSGFILGSVYSAIQCSIVDVYLFGLSHWDHLVGLMLCPDLKEWILRYFIVYNNV